MNELQIILKKLDKLDVLDEKFDGLGKKFENLEERFGGLEERVGGLEERFGGLEERFGGLEERVGGLEERFGGLEERFGGLEERVGGLEKQVSDIKMTLENETNRNIKVIAEAHLDLSRKLDAALKVENEKEMLIIRVNHLENEVQKIKEKLEEIA